MGVVVPSTAARRRGAAPEADPSGPGAPPSAARTSVVGSVPAVAALFEPDGERIVPTGLARGPWDPGALHGGPVAALVGRAAEAHEGDGSGRGAAQRVVRLTVDLVRPCP